MKIPYTAPSITEKEIAYISDAAKNGWGKNCYDYINLFEQKFNDYLGTKYSIATSSCTGAIHMGLAALGIGSGDEVILANTNWIATAAPIIHLGAKPVFVDILPFSWCIDPAKAEAAITKDTKAIIAVHLYGNLCDMHKLKAIANKYNLFLIEDSAESLGSVYYGKNTGSLGEFGTFSFHGTKVMTTGEGGMFVTNNRDLYDKVLTLSNHGRSTQQQKQFWPDTIGFKYKMSNIQAALGCAQIERIDELVSKKRYIFERYRSRLRGLPIMMNPEEENCINSYWMPTIVFDKTVGTNRSALQKLFQENEIDARVFFWPLSIIYPLGRRERNELLISESIHHKALNLPSFYDMTDEQIDRVCSILDLFFSRLGA